MAKSKDSKPAGGKGGGKADTKADKSKKGGGKGSNSKTAGAADSSSDTKASKLKGMTINVRHILVCSPCNPLGTFTGMFRFVCDWDTRV
jgi:NIMA-interacting peptidyl-prolyl cis-trans isomerase 4